MKPMTLKFSALAIGLAALIGYQTSALASETPSAATAAASSTQQDNQGLKTQVFNPGEKAIFAVSSVLIEGKTSAILIDAQFSAEQARKLAELVKASGKTLTEIYISHGDPDFYFGLETLHKAFPAAKIVATPQTIAHIKATKDEKLKIWGPKLGDNAPSNIIVPEPLQGHHLSLDGQHIQIVGLDGPTPDRTFLWIPSIKTVVGGIPVASGKHLWMADTQTPQSHKDWLNTLEQIKKLSPERVIPGHFEGNILPGVEALTFTADYIRAFDEETAKAKNAQELINAMKKRYPDLKGESALELSAKVAKGEMTWK